MPSCYPLSRKLQTVRSVRYQLTKGHVASGCGLLAIAAQSTMYPVGLLIPMTAAKPVRGVIAFISISAMICAISFALVGYNWPGQTWGTA